MVFNLIYHGNIRDSVTKFYDYENLVNYLSRYNCSDGTNWILDLIRDGIEDFTYKRDVYITPNGTVGTRIIRRIKPYELLGKHGVNMMNDQLRLDVLNHAYFSKKREASKKRRRYEDKANRSVFRRGPVNNIRKWRGGGGYYRMYRCYGALRDAADPENKEFIRKSRSISNLPDSWSDERYRDSERNWKSQGRYHKQWEKGVATRNKKSKSYVIKNFSKHNIVDMEEDE